MSIPFDHITIGDGTAWLLCDLMADGSPGIPFHGGGAVISASGLDRPCDTCDGRGWRPLRDGPIRGIVVIENGLSPLGGCPDCSSTGRHTFTIRTPGPMHGVTMSLRVSVVPDMVLQLLGRLQGATSLPAIMMSPSGRWVLHHSPRAKAIREPITLPDAAAPGMWAVQLRIHEGSGR